MFGTLVVEEEGGEKYRKQRGKGLPIGLIASASAPFLGEIAKPYLNLFFMVEDVADVTKNCT